MKRLNPSPKLPVLCPSFDHSIDGEHCPSPCDPWGHWVIHAFDEWVSPRPIAPDVSADSGLRSLDRAGPPSGAQTACTSRATSKVSSLRLRRRGRRTPYGPSSPASKDGPSLSGCTHPSPRLSFPWHSAPKCWRNFNSRTGTAGTEARLPYFCRSSHLTFISASRPDKLSTVIGSFFLHCPVYLLWRLRRVARSHGACALCRSCSQKPGWRAWHSFSTKASPRATSRSRAYTARSSLPGRTLLAL